LSIPVEDIMEMFLEDLSVFCVVHGNFTFVIGEVFGVVYTMMCIETFHNFENNVPCSFQVHLELVTLAFFSEVTLPFAFNSSFLSLQVSMCLF